MPSTGPQRRAGRRIAVEIDLTLSRGRGGPIHAHTVDLGERGMRVVCDRPLSVDEVLDFDLPLPAAGAAQVDGRARVLREQASNVYALRFERVDEALLSKFVARAA